MQCSGGAPFQPCLPSDVVGDYDPVHTFYLTHTDFGSHMVLEERDQVRARNFYAPFCDVPFYGPFCDELFCGPLPWEEARSYHSSYMTPSRTSRYVPPPRITTTYSSELHPRYPRSSDVNERVVKRVERVVETSSSTPRFY
ncbi:uncharacterized protein LOC119093082 isoform X2 [Pollicipes pollicipes]|uniref:uncharacterized protein LOC119093082 isoform X2 n=1 Tax=Pollicipes pollicipes TaxID=41117 RepID=UPI001884EB0E|nr:uncharacterized protein LOC119093082 isoform X2 [Pollicipes pollicipes]